MQVTTCLSTATVARVRWRRAAAAALLLAAGCASSVTGHGRVASACPAAFFGVAGSGQGVHNPAPATLPAGVSAGDALRYGTTVGLVKVLVARLAGTRLASAAAVDYPAIPVTQYIGPGGLTGDLDASEAQGVQVLLSLIRRARTGPCARRPVLLSGYSQGAEVVVRTVAALPVDQRSSIAVALFGNRASSPGCAATSRATPKRPASARRSGTRHSPCPRTSGPARSTSARQAIRYVVSTRRLAHCWGG